MPPKTRTTVESFTKKRIESEPLDDWVPYWKLGATIMRRVSGPFKVKTREGWSTCQDGWLAVDGGGWPYPIDADEQVMSFTPEDPYRSQGIINQTLDANPDSPPWYLITTLLIGAGIGALATFAGLQALGA